MSRGQGEESKWGEEGDKGERWDEEGRDKVGYQVRKDGRQVLDDGENEEGGGENNVNLHPELDDGRCGVDEWDQDCMAQKTKHEVDAGAVYSSGYEHCKCQCDVSGGKAAMVGESP